MKKKTEKEKKSLLNERRPNFWRVSRIPYQRSSQRSSPRLTERMSKSSEMKSGQWRKALASRRQWRWVRHGFGFGTEIELYEGCRKWKNETVATELNQRWENLNKNSNEQSISEFFLKVGLIFFSIIKFSQKYCSWCWMISKSIKYEEFMKSHKYDSIKFAYLKEAHNFFKENPFKKSKLFTYSLRYSYCFIQIIFFSLNP